jgi:hypothetical protein
MLVALKAYAKEHYVRGIKGTGGSEKYVVFMTPTGVAALKRDPDYLANVRNAAPRSDDNPLFSGAVADVDGLVIHEFRHVPNTLGASTKFGSGRHGRRPAHAALRRASARHGRPRLAGVGGEGFRLREPARDLASARSLASRSRSSARSTTGPTRTSARSFATPRSDTRLTERRSI